MPLIVLAAVVGVCFGSFANVIVFRLPRKARVTSPPSTCPACGYRIAFYDLLPIISWILLKGRCRNCRTGISFRYPLIEFTCALLFVGMVLLTPTLSAVFLSLFAFILVAISFIDWDTQDIPDVLLLTAALLGAGWVAAGHFSPLFSKAPGFIDAGLGILAGGLPLLMVDKLVLVLYKKDGFGYGDVKLMAVAGLFLGWRYVFVAFFIAFLAGGVYAAFLLITGRARRGEYIAFGPFLCAGIIAALWFGQALWEFFIK